MVYSVTRSFTDHAGTLDYRKHSAVSKHNVKQYLSVVCLVNPFVCQEVLAAPVRPNLGMFSRVEDEVKLSEQFN